MCGFGLPGTVYGLKRHGIFVWLWKITVEQESFAAFSLHRMELWVSLCVDEETETMRFSFYREKRTSTRSDFVISSLFT